MFQVASTGLLAGLRDAETAGVMTIESHTQACSDRILRIGPLRDHQFTGRRGASRA